MADQIESKTFDVTTNANGEVVIEHGFGRIPMSLTPAIVEDVQKPGPYAFYMNSWNGTEAKLTLIDRESGKIVANESAQVRLAAEGELKL